MELLFLESALLVLGVNSADYAEEYFQRNRLWPLRRHRGGFQDNGTPTKHCCLESSLVRMIATTNSSKHVITAWQIMDFDQQFHVTKVFRTMEEVRWGLRSCWFEMQIQTCSRACLMNRVLSAGFGNYLWQQPFQFCVYIQRNIFFASYL